MGAVATRSVLRGAVRGVARLAGCWVAGVVLVLCVGGARGADAELAPLVTNVDGREAVSLNGHWHAIVDPYEVGYYDYRYKPSEWGFFRDAKARNKSDLIEYDFDASGTLGVPGDWNTQRAELMLYEGTVWYRRKFDFTPEEGKRTFLHFGAANYEARVYLNGEALGAHVGGFTPFQFEVTGKLRAGENTVVVKVDNRRHQDAIPTVNTDWWNYGGLTRRVMLVSVPETFVRDYMVQLDPRDESVIRGWVRLSGVEAGLSEVTVSVPEAGIETVVTTDGLGHGSFEVEAPGLELWSPGHPKLYDVVLRVNGHELHDQIGFRTVRTEGSRILLNGEPIFLRGVCLHEEAPIRGGRAFGVEDSRAMLGWAKELGCNFVRLAHYPHHEQMLREADREGVLVWAEVPVYWTISWDNPETFRNAQHQLAEMITRDRNRASVILWSVANETPRTDRRLAFLSDLVDTARGLDPTRLVTSALETQYVDSSTIEVGDPLGEKLDVLGCNEYIGWYDGGPDKPKRISWTTPYDKPLVISEFGGGALAGHHGDADARWTEEYQAEIYRSQVRMLERIDFLAGCAPWILMDFRSPRRLLPGIQDGWNRKGLVSERGEKKEAFGVLRAFYTRRADDGADDRE